MLVKLSKEKNLALWLGGRDSNLDNVVQSHVNVLRCALVCSGWLRFSRPRRRFALVRFGVLWFAPVQRVSNVSHFVKHSDKRPKVPLTRLTIREVAPLVAAGTLLGLIVTPSLM